MSTVVYCRYPRARIPPPDREKEVHMSDQINYRRHGLVDSSRLTLAADFDLLDALGAAVGGATERTGSEGHFPSLDGATIWLNSAPLTPDGLRGKVVAVDFWT